MARLPILGLLFALTACTTYTRKECETMDWPAHGREAALNGKDARADLADVDVLRFALGACVEHSSR